MLKSEVSQAGEKPFESIESALEFVALLCEAIEEARREVEAEIALAQQAGEQRRVQALQVVAYNLTKLAAHMRTSRRILNDLRTLRRLLFGEREQGRAAIAGAGEVTESGSDGQIY